MFGNWDDDDDDYWRRNMMNEKIPVVAPEVFVAENEPTVTDVDTGAAQ